MKVTPWRRFLAPFSHRPLLPGTVEDPETVWIRLREGLGAAPLLRMASHRNPWTRGTAAKDWQADRINRRNLLDQASGPSLPIQA